MTLNQAIQIADSYGCNLSEANFVSFDGTFLSMGDFVMIDCQASGRSYFGQVCAPNTNLNRDGLGPLDVTSLNPLELVLRDRIDRNVPINEMFLYRVLLLNEVSGGSRQSLTRRPQIAARARPASEEEAIRYLGLPSLDENLQLGQIARTSIPVCLDQRTLFHHLLVAGSTGAGKSNVNANIIRASHSLGAFVFVCDHKPDYQHLDERNDEGEGDWYGPLKDVCFWGLTSSGRMRSDELSIAIPASRLNKRLLANNVFFRPDEYHQADTLAALLEWFEVEPTQQGRDWSFADFCQACPDSVGEANKRLGYEVNASTYKTMYRKMRQTGRKPAWVDGDGCRPMGAAVYFQQERDSALLFDPVQFIRPGGTAVIRIPNDEASGRDYALFLTYALDCVYAARDHTNVPIVLIIDEAQDLFSASKAFKEQTGSTLHHHVRRGRSRKIGFVIGVQSADAVPDYILNQLNSRIIGRHNNIAQAREALPGASQEQLDAMLHFGPGEALVSFFGSSAVVHAHMRRSPYRLTKE